MKPKITPHLWFVKEAQEAAQFYTRIFPDSRVDRTVPLPAASPSGPEGAITFVELTLCGQAFHAISAGPLDSFNHAVSFQVCCEDQAEIDRYWALLGEGGQHEECGWLRDRYGLSWQVLPTRLSDMLADRDRDRARRVAQALLKMKKIDVAGLEAAYRGDQPRST